MAKDARLARDTAPELVDCLPAIRAVIATLEEGEAAGFGGENLFAMMKLLERRTGRKIGK